MKNSEGKGVDDEQTRSTSRKLFVCLVVFCSKHTNSASVWSNSENVIGQIDAFVKVIWVEPAHVQVRLVHPAKIDAKRRRKQQQQQQQQQQQPKKKS